MLYTPMLSLLFWFAVPNFCEAFDEPPNAQHLFNAIHSSMRQWGSSLNHNGMSFFLATVPQGTQLYHGTGRNRTFTGLEWLAFEPEHALNFAWRVERPDQDGSGLHEDVSMKWRADLDLVKDSYNTAGRELFINGPPGHDLPKPSRKPRPRHPPNITMHPGWLHSYAAKRDLNLLYVDGMSAAKNPMGTLDSQDYVLRLHNPEKGHPFQDFARAADMCDLAANQWQSKVDGFVRMEHGFEIVLCEFANLDLLGMSRNRGWNSTNRPPLPLDKGADTLSFFRAVTARYDGIGGERARLRYDNFVSAYSYPDLDLFRGGNDLPRLQHASTSTMRRLLDDVTQLVLHSPVTSHSETVNWQAIADEVVERYAKRLKYFVSGLLATKPHLDMDVERLLQPFIDYDNRSVSGEIERCALHFMPDPVKGPPKDCLAGRSVYAISHRICHTLQMVLQDQTHANAVERLQILIEYLDWTTWKYCDPSCGLDEVCFTAIWPYGDVEDHYHPSCRTGSSIFNRSTYWGF